MIEFYYYYDSNTHKGRLVYGVSDILIDKIICSVATMTERKETSPKFVVKGVANSIIISEVDGVSVAYISN